jgi:hypothetical protein
LETLLDALTIVAGELGFSAFSWGVVVLFLTGLFVVNSIFTSAAES